MTMQSINGLLLKAFIKVEGDFQGLGINGAVTEMKCVVA